jgi:hypothetical protein
MTADANSGKINSRNISEISGAERLLPGESEADYGGALSEMLRELEAKTPLQVYLVEQIHDCLYWMRRYASQKRMLILKEIVKQLPYPKTYLEDFEGKLGEEGCEILQVLAGGTKSKKIDQLLKKSGQTLESLQLEAIDKLGSRLRQLDDMIFIKAKLLAGLQSSFEMVANRKLVRERLRLQVDSMRRDLEAIEHDIGKTTSS